MVRNRPNSVIGGMQSEVNEMQHSRTRCFSICPGASLVHLNDRVMENVIKNQALTLQHVRKLSLHLFKSGFDPYVLESIIHSAEGGKLELGEPQPRPCA